MSQVPPMTEDYFNFGPVPLAGESQTTYQMCAFCEVPLKSSAKFFPIDKESQKIAGIPIVITNMIHPEANCVCIEHWQKNKMEYEVCSIPFDCFPIHF